MLLRLLAISASAALLAGAAHAQASDAAPVNPPPAAAAAPVDTTGYNVQSSAGAAIPASTSTLGDPAAMKAGDPGVVSNGPVPDTKENRAKYGRPDSSAGKHTSPAGN